MNARLLVERFKREDGQALAEYALILAFIAVACVIALGLLGLAVTGVYGHVAEAF